jgi:tetratricopeptide (TPR) repeat protein
LKTVHDPSPRAAWAGRFQLLRRIAVGGMGEIFLARDAGDGGLDRLVAIKRLLPDLAEQPEAVSRFVDEARVTALLAHPNLVAVHELGRDDDGYFIVMEYIDGQPLSRVLQRARELGVSIPRPLAVHLVGEVLRGLAYAHRARDSEDEPLNLVHRDLSPRNVLIGCRGEVKVMDFGIAKTDLARSRTVTGVVRGTFGYMSPEQARGERVDERSDVFAAAVLLWELTLGRRLFDGADEVATLDRVREGRIPRPRDVDPAYPEDLEEVLCAALEPERERRTPSAAAFGAELSKFLDRRGASPRTEDVRALLEQLFGPAEPDETADGGPATAFTRRDIPTTPAPRAVRRRAAVVGAALAGAVVAVVVAALLLRGERTSGAADVPLDRIWSAIHDREFERARLGVSRLLVQRPADPDAHVLSVLAHWWLTSPQLWHAIEQAKAAPLSEPQRALVEGLQLVDRGRNQEAIQFLRGVIERFPDSAAVQYALGEALWHGGLEERAAPHLVRAFELDPRWRPGLQHFVDLHLLRADAAALEPVVRRLREVDPAGAAALEIATHLAEGRTAEALAMARRATEDQPDASLLWQRRAEVEAVSGDFEAGARAARRAFELWPVDDRDAGGFAHWTEFFLYRGDLDGYRKAVGGRGTRASMLLTALWLDRDEIGAPAPIPLRDLPDDASRSQMPPPVLWAAVSVLGAHQRGEDARDYYTWHPAPEVAAYGDALAAERADDWAGAAGHHRRARELTYDPAMRLLAGYHLARALRRTGDHAGAAEACAEVLAPRAYRPIRAVLWPDCVAWTAEIAAPEEAAALRRRLTQAWIGGYPHPAVQEP